MFRNVIFHFSRYGARFILSEWYVKEYIVSHNSVAKKSCERSCRNPASRLSRATCTSPWRDEGKIARNDFLLLFLLFFRSQSFLEIHTCAVVEYMVLNEQTTTKSGITRTVMLLRSKCKNEAEGGRERERNKKFPEEILVVNIKKKQLGT